MCSVDYSWVLSCVFANSCLFAVVLFLRAKRCHTTALKVYKVFTSFVVSHHIHLSVFPGVSECTWWNKASRLVTFISLLVMFRNQAPHILLWETTCPLVSRLLLVGTDPLKSRSSNFGRNHNDRRWLRHNKCTFTIWGFLCHHVTCSHQLVTVRRPHRAVCTAEGSVWVTQITCRHCCSPACTHHLTLLTCKPWRAHIYLAVICLQQPSHYLKATLHLWQVWVVWTLFGSDEQTQANKCWTHLLGAFWSDLAWFMHLELKCRVYSREQVRWGSLFSLREKKEFVRLWCQDLWCSSSYSPNSSNLQTPGRKLGGTFPAGILNLS